MNSCEDKIKWFCEKLFENIKMLFLCLSVLVIGIGLVGIEALSKRTNLPKEVLAFVLIALFTQVVLSIIDNLDQENKTEPKKKSDFVYRNKEGHLVHYYPNGYDVVSKSQTQFENSCETSYDIREKSTNPIQDAIKKDKEKLDQILDEDTSKEIIPDAPAVSTSAEDDTLEASDLEQPHQEVKQTHTETTIGDALDIIKNHSDSMVVKQEGRHLNIKTTLKGDDQ